MFVVLPVTGSNPSLGGRFLAFTFAFQLLSLTQSPPNCLQRALRTSQICLGLAQMMIMTCKKAFIASAVKNGIDFLAGNFLQLDNTFQYAFECVFKTAAHDSGLK
jgi:hypothetical protein